MGISRPLGVQGNRLMGFHKPRKLSYCTESRLSLINKRRENSLINVGSVTSFPANSLRCCQFYLFIFAYFSPYELNKDSKAVLISCHKEYYEGVGSGPRGLVGSNLSHTDQPSWLPRTEALPSMWELSVLKPGQF